MRLSPPAICLVAAMAVLVPATGRSSPAVHQRLPPHPARLVAIGDLHADIEAARRAFRLAGAISAHDVWIGRDLTIVQMGDVIGRGADDREVLDFVLDVQAKARAAGGTVHLLLGNHEVFAARPDHRWVDPVAFAAFRSVPELNLQHPRVAGLPSAERHRAAALMPGGVYARRLASFPAVLRVGRTIFAHGGVLPQWARYGIDRINEDVREWLLGRRPNEPAATQGVDDGSLDDGVMWSRHFAADLGGAGCGLLQESLSVLGAARMVAAHTVHKTITSRCDDRAWAIDVGISRYYGGALEVLEIIDDRQLRIIRWPPPT